MRTGAGGAGRQQRTAVQLEAAALQVDSHLPEHVHPVLLSTAPLATTGRNSRPPLHLDLEVHILPLIPQKHPKQWSG